MPSHQRDADRQRDVAPARRFLPTNSSPPSRSGPRRPQEISFLASTEMIVTTRRERFFLAMGIHQDELAGIRRNRPDRFKRKLKLIGPIPKQLLDMLGRNSKEKFEIFAVV